MQKHSHQNNSISLNLACPDNMLMNLMMNFNHIDRIFKTELVAICVSTVFYLPWSHLNMEEKSMRCHQITFKRFMMQSEQIVEGIITSFKPCDFTYIFSGAN